MPPAPEPTVAPPAPPAADPLTQPLIDFLPSSVLPPAPGAPAPAPAPGPAVAEQPTAERTWPCTSCGTANPLAATQCVACGAAFLAAVAADSRAALVLPVVGDLTKMSRSQRLLGAFTFVIVLVLFVAVVTLLLSKRPPENGGPLETPSQEPTITVIQPTTAPPVTGLPGFPPTPAPSSTATVTPTGTATVTP